MSLSVPHSVRLGHLSYLRAEIDSVVPEQHRQLINRLLAIFPVIDALRTLQSPKGNLNDHEAIRLNLVKDVEERLQAVANTQGIDPHIRDLLLSRASGFQTGDFIKPACQCAADADCPIELIIGANPAWRFTESPNLFTATLAVRCHLNDDIALAADSLASRSINELDIDLQPSHSAPPQILTELVAVAGEAATHPMHIANFLPEDEGFLEKPAVKTVIYQNLYRERVQRISLPLYNLIYPQSSESGHIPTIEPLRCLLLWFRGHDIGHTYFDQMSRKVPNLTSHHRATFDELNADLLGLLLAVPQLLQRTGIVRP